jgi:parvulin-like peptidyl-prolyl isomerase
MNTALLFLLTAGCHQTEAPSAPPLVTDAEDSAEPTPAPKREVQQIAEIPNPRIRARHILFAYADAKGAGPHIERSKEAAKTLADEIKAELQAGADFETLAKTHSDDGSGKRGGDLGVFTSGVMNPVFEETTLALSPGEQSAVVETPFGFHIIERLEVIELALAHILVQWVGLKKSRSDRTRADAQTRAEQALALIEAGQPFSTVAKDWSDGPFGKRGGQLGWFQKGQMAPQFDEAAFALKPGDHTGIVESSHGFHIIKRLK